jgi:hypothetical protein
MSAKGLAKKLSQDMGETFEEDDAQHLIDDFFETYAEYRDWVRDIKQEYNLLGTHQRLPDGWTLWGDNNNMRSVANFPIQGMGSCILRKAIQLCQDAGLTVIIPLHDALYIEFDYGDWDKIDIMAECMRDAFAFYFDKRIRNIAYELIRLDANVWGPDCGEGGVFTPNGMDVKSQRIYIDERSVKEYEKYSKYF